MILSGRFGVLLVTICWAEKTLLYPQSESYTGNERGDIAVRSRKLNGGLFEQYIIAPGAIHPEDDKSTDRAASKRMKRNMFAIGLAATKALLLNAKKRYSRGNIKLYEKPGNYHNAVHDFYSAYPTEVRTIRLSNGFVAKVGKVGDRRLYVHDGNPERNPVLEIIPVRQPNMNENLNSYRITYTEHFFVNTGPKARADNDF